MLQYIFKHYAYLIPLVSYCYSRNSSPPPPPTPLPAYFLNLFNFTRPFYTSSATHHHVSRTDYAATLLFRGSPFRGQLARLRTGARRRALLQQGKAAHVEATGGGLLSDRSLHGRRPSRRRP